MEEREELNYETRTPSQESGEQRGIDLVRCAWRKSSWQAKPIICYLKAAHVEYQEVFIQVNRVS